MNSRIKYLNRADTMTREDINLTKISWGLLAILMGGAITWCGWVTISISERPPAAEISRMLESSSPYVRDRAAIESRLGQIDKIEGRLATVIERNTEAINLLRVEIAKLSTVTSR